MRLIITFFLLITLSVISRAEWQPGDDLKDSRDGQIYKTIKIGDQVWMAENLNIGAIIPSTKQGFQMKDDGEIEKYCWDNDEGNCDGNGVMKRGGFYEWGEAMEYPKGEVSNPHQGICPKGWHIPSAEEWEELFNHLGGQQQAIEKLLKGGSSGFDALLTGYRCTMTGGFRTSAFGHPNVHKTYFWSTSESDANPNNAPLYELGESDLKSFEFSKSLGLCVRCIWDGETSSLGPEIQIDKSSLDFGEIDVKTTSILNFEISNTGDEELTISDFEITGNSSGVFTISSSQFPVSIIPGNSQEFVVEFSPKQQLKYSAEITVVSNAVNQIQDIQIKGEGIKNEPHIECASVPDFGEVENSATRSFKIKNTGTKELTVNKIKITGEDTKAFALKNPDIIPLIVEANSDEDIEVVFIPIKKGEHSAVLEVYSDAPNAEKIELALSGIGIATHVFNERTNIKNQLYINPNPVTDLIIISGNIEYNEQVEIYTLEGVCVHHGWGRRIDVSNLTPGVYFLRLGEEFKQFVKI